jgi:hypothetical protein
MNYFKNIIFGFCVTSYLYGEVPQKNNEIANQKSVSVDQIRRPFTTARIVLIDDEANMSRPYDPREPAIQYTDKEGRHWDYVKEDSRKDIVIGILAAITGTILFFSILDAVRGKSNGSANSHTNS